MPIGSAGKEQFSDAQISLRNVGLIAYVGSLMLFREEYLADDQLALRSGFDDPTLVHYDELMKEADATRRLITDNPNKTDLKTLVASTTDAAQNITTAPAIAGLENIKRSAGAMISLPYALDGTDPNIPLGSQLNIRNPLALVILATLDRQIVAATRVEDRFATSRITAQTSLQLYGGLQEIYAAVHDFGGSKNEISIIGGTRRGEEPRGPAAAANAANEAVLGAAASR